MQTMQRPIEKWRESLEMNGPMQFGVFFVSGGVVAIVFFCYEFAPVCILQSVATVTSVRLFIYQVKHRKYLTFVGYSLVIETQSKGRTDFEKRAAHFGEFMCNRFPK